MLIAIALYDGFTALDVIGPYAVLSQLPGAEIAFVAASAGPVVDDGRLTVQAPRAFADVPHADVVLVGGGVATRRLVRDGAPVIDWLAAVHPTTTWTTSVCTGSLLLAAAGVLDGIEATTHWAAFDQLDALGALPCRQRIVERGRIVTGAGVSAGIDLALTLAARLMGDDVARAVQLGIEYDPEPPFTAGSPRTAPTDLVELVRGLVTERERATLAAG